MKQETIINTEKALYDYIELLRSNFDEHKYLRVDMKTGKQRTGLQNRCLHLYCEMIATALHSRGITFQMFFNEGFQVPWTRDIVKDNVWRPVQLAICGKESTTKPLTNEYSEIYKYLNLKLVDWGFNIPWPNKLDI